MPRYMLRVSYTPEGAKGVMKEGGTGRRKLVEELTSQTGGSVEAFYFALGEDDVYVITDFPDNVTAAAVSMTVNSSGAARVKTVALLTPEEVDEATRKSIPYRAPGA